MSDISMTLWDSILRIDEDKNGHVTILARGKVNLGRLRDKDMSFFSDAHTEFSDLNLVIKDLNTGEELVPELLLDEPKYKRIKIPFKYPIDEGEEFGFEARYILPKAFNTVGEDFYSQMLRHNVEKFSLKVQFPSNVEIVDITGSNLKTSGGIMVDLGPEEMPEIVNDGDVQGIQWDMKYARLGYNFTMAWKTAPRSD